MVHALSGRGRTAVRPYADAHVVGAHGCVPGLGTRVSDSLVNSPFRE